MNKKDIDMLVEKYSQLNETDGVHDEMKTQIEGAIQTLLRTDKEVSANDIHQYVVIKVPNISSDAIKAVLDDMMSKGTIKQEVVYTAGRIS